jgi:hypothetical protein
MSASPLAQAQVLHLARILIGDVPGVADEQGADPVSHGKGDRLPGGFMLGLVDAATMTILGLPEPGPVTPPPARPALTRLGGSSRRLGLAGLLVAEVQVALGPDRPARHQQRGLVGDQCIGVDDANVHSGHLARVQVLRLDGDGGGDAQPQPPAVGQQRDCSNLLNGIRKGPGEPYPQCRTASGDWQPHPSPLHQERAAVPADETRPRLRRGNPAAVADYAVWRPGTKRRCSGAAPTVPPPTIALRSRLFSPTLGRAPDSRRPPAARAGVVVGWYPAATPTRHQLTAAAGSSDRPAGG